MRKLSAISRCLVSIEFLYFHNSLCVHFTINVIFFPMQMKSLCTLAVFFAPP